MDSVITATDIFWLMLATAATSGVLIILSALVTGYLVFRTKKEQHETLFPRKMANDNGPIVIDDGFGDYGSDDGLPDVLKRMNEKLAADLSLSAMKEKRNG